MCTAVLIGCDPATPPLPPQLNSYYVGAIGQQWWRHLFVTPWCKGVLHWFIFPGSGEQRNWPRLKNKPEIPVFQKDFCTHVDMFCDFLLPTYKGYLHVKIKLFLTVKSDQDPDPPWSALVLLPRSGSWIINKVIVAHHFWHGFV
jgi:hypothetical protein